MISAIGEITGALAVVVSLVYLARQIAFSNRLAQAEAFRSPISDINNLNATFAMDPVYREAVFRVIEGASPDDLDADQIQLVEIFLISVLNCYEQLFREVRRGVLDEEALSEWGGTFLFGLPFLRGRWSGMRQRLGPPFVEYIESSYDMRWPEPETA
ncbi:MAG: hypothetical protein JSU98_15545 [Gemmatimonadales bacterium]|jgi:hypothetical protein|nr:MAG: hypothetical protein JSU98_15545 [Gemmatimonadales bacterium]